MNANPKEEAKQLKAEGYRRVSNSGRHLSRIDREDWKLHMAKMHAPWDQTGAEGMKWVEILDSSDSAEDHYRRCYSKDVVSVSQTVYKLIPASGFARTGFCKQSPTIMVECYYCEKKFTIQRPVNSRTSYECNDCQEAGDDDCWVRDNFGARG